MYASSVDGTTGKGSSGIAHNRLPPIRVEVRDGEPSTPEVEDRYLRALAKLIALDMLAEMQEHGPAEQAAHHDTI